MALTFYANCLQRGNLHEMSVPISFEKLQEYFRISFEFFYTACLAVRVNVNMLPTAVNKKCKRIMKEDSQKI